MPAGRQGALAASLLGLAHPPASRTPGQRVLPRCRDRRDGLPRLNTLYQFVDRAGTKVFLEALYNSLVFSESL
jgi:hypothetical protein